MALAGFAFFGERPGLKFILSVVLALAGLFLLVGLEKLQGDLDYRNGVIFGLLARHSLCGFFTGGAPGAKRRRGTHPMGQHGPGVFFVRAGHDTHDPASGRIFRLAPSCGLVLHAGLRPCLPGPGGGCSSPFPCPRWLRARADSFCFPSRPAPLSGIFCSLPGHAPQLNWPGPLWRLWPSIWAVRSKNKAARLCPALFGSYTFDDIGYCGVDWPMRYLL